MGILNNINLITVSIACIFIIPVLVGIIRPLTSCRIHRSLVLLLNSIIFLISIILSGDITRAIMSGNENFILKFFYDLIPGFHNAVLSRELWLYPVLLAALALILCVILRLLLFPVYRFALNPITKNFSSVVDSLSGAGKRAISGLWKMPGAITLVLLISALLNIYTCFFSSPSITDYINGSAPYRVVQGDIIQPTVGDSVVSDMQCLLDDSFKSAQSGLSGPDGKNRLSKYFNGVAVEEAVKSNAEIDQAAKEIASSAKSDEEKAFLIYKWISRNISYDNNKSIIMRFDPTKVSSGAIATYKSRTGVCFDYSSLYVAMSRAVGLKVRLLSGYGYTGITWVDHAWNQVFNTQNQIWINLDSTFGASGINYFDKPYFDLDHRDGIVQGEW